MHSCTAATAAAAAVNICETREFEQRKYAEKGMKNTYRQTERERGIKIDGDLSEIESEWEGVRDVPIVKDMQ